MALQRITRRSVPDEVFDQLLGEVVSGERQAHDSLPSERHLAEVLGVSRPAVREAMQRMAQAGLVTIRHGGGATVRDFRRHGGLDLLASLLVRKGKVDLKVARSILEARLEVGPKVAALAAERTGARLAPALTDAVEALRVDPDAVARQRTALMFWDHVVDGADSIVFRLMFNSLRAAYEPALEALASVMASEVDRIDTYRDLAAAIVAGDPDAARGGAEDLLTPATTAFLDIFRSLEEP